MSSFSVTLPDDLEERVVAEAEASGVSLDQYIATILALRVGALAEVGRSFSARAGRAVPGRARAVLARAGQGNAPQPGDDIEVDRVSE